MKPGSIRAWLELLRVPNLLTVPGDPLAGWALATAGSPAAGIPWTVCVASILFYAGGLLLNDVADAAEDRAARPNRPIPSGRVSRAAAACAAFALAAAGMVLCFRVSLKTGFAAAELLVVVCLYDLWFKRLPVVGPVAMGFCRGLNILLGAAAAPACPTSVVVLVAAGAETLYIAGVTQLARRETRHGTWWTPSRIGMLIGGLLWIQAAFCIAAGGAGIWIGVALATLWLPLRALRRRFEMS
jgi:4-hydroxybenzoate polyprenyltransferase